jgi:hypothetical protein
MKGCYFLLQQIEVFMYVKSTCTPCHQDRASRLGVVVLTASIPSTEQGSRSHLLNHDLKLKRAQEKAKTG